MYKVSLRKNKSIDANNAYRVTTIDDVTGEAEVMDVHTSSRNEGLWINGSQVEGTSQFTFVGSHSYRSYFQNRYSDC